MSSHLDRVAVVLAGGEGRRMGGGKPLRSFGGATLIARALELAHRYADRVAVAVRDPAQVAGAGDVRLLLDDPALGGPIAGLASALTHARRCGAALVLTLPCDTPLLPPDLFSRLHAALTADAAGVALAASRGRMHPACALWRTTVAARLPAYLAAGRRSLMGFAEVCRFVEVGWPSSDVDPFANANTPEDLRRLQPVAASPRFVEA